MAEQQQVMDETIENLLRAFRKKLTPNCTRRLLEAGVDVGQKLKPMYPRTVQDGAQSMRSALHTTRRRLAVAPAKI